MNTDTRNVLTIATGKPLFLNLAVSLARSFYYWNKDEGINFYLATDLAEFVPDDLKSFVKIVTLKPNEFGLGFSPKLHLDKIAPQGQTLFIDSDCLIYGNLSRVFEKFRGHNVSVTGSYISAGDWFGNVADICKKFSVDKIPKFNGGVYYLENGDKAKLVYQYARELENQYDEVGFVRLRNRPNDEVIMALAMAVHQETLIFEDGSIMAEFFSFRSGIDADLLTGKAILYNTPGHRNYQKNWPLLEAKPLIVHYLGYHNEIMPYIKEVEHLKYIFLKRYPRYIARFLTAVSISFPWTLKNYLKICFRPLYHYFFGARQIKTSERIVND